MTLLCTELIPKSATSDLQTKAVTLEPVDQQMPQLVEAPSRRAERRMALTWAVSGSWLQQQSGVLYREFFRMLGPAVSMEPVIELVYEGLYMLRVELSFLAVFAFLWLAGHFLVAKNDPVKSRKTGPTGSTSRRATRRVDESLTPSTVEPEKLQDPQWVVAQVSALCRAQVQRALELYRVAVRAGLNIKDAALLASATKLCTSKQLFADCLSIYDFTSQDPALEIQDALAAVFAWLLQKTQKTSFHTSKLNSQWLFVSEERAAQNIWNCSGGPDSSPKTVSTEKSLNFAKVTQDKSVWSCLLFCAVETKGYHRCTFFFEQLKANGSPSPKDFGNMVRYASSTSNWRLALNLIDEMHKALEQAQVEVDSVVYNTVLAACVSAEQLDQARKLLDQMVAAGGVTDVITYNTLAKGYAKAGRMDTCFELYELMRSRGLSPSQVTYGILLDGFINDNEVEKAVEIFNTMRAEGCQMNTVLYTTLIKGFARAGQVDQAVQIYEEMRKDAANCDVGRLEEALKMLLAMKEAGLKPDEVVFNNLLGGCINDCKLELAKDFCTMYMQDEVLLVYSKLILDLWKWLCQDLYKEMIASNVKPSVATFSILIRKRWDEALDLLRQELPTQKVSPEPRLYGQLAQCCLRDRQGRRATEVYKLLTETSTPTAAMNSTLLGMCAKLNMLDTGADIMHLAAEANSRVDPRDAAMMLEAALRKKKPQVMGLLKEAMVKLNLPVDLSSAADCVRSGADGVAVARQPRSAEKREGDAQINIEGEDGEVVSVLAALLAEVRSALTVRTKKVLRGFRGTTSTKLPRTILDETDELGKSVDKDVSILIENKPLEKPQKEVQAPQTACAEKDAKEPKAPVPKDAGLLSLNDLPSKSQSALRPLLQRYGEARHKEVLALHTFLGDGQARSSCLRRRCG
eukprot:s257_g24.t1